MKVAVRWYNRVAAVFRLEEAMDGLSGWNQECTNIEYAHYAPRETLCLSSLCLKFWCSRHRCREATSGVSGQNHILSIFQDEPF